MKEYMASFLDSNGEKVRRDQEFEAENMASAMLVVAEMIPKIQGNAHIIEVTVENYSDEDDIIDIEDET